MFKTVTKELVNILRVELLSSVQLATRNSLATVILHYYADSVNYLSYRILELFIVPVYIYLQTVVNSSRYVIYSYSIVEALDNQFELNFK